MNGPTMAQRRGRAVNKPETMLMEPPPPPPSGGGGRDLNDDDPAVVGMVSSSIVNNELTPSSHLHLKPAMNAVVVATVRRRFCGTGPFDKHWLNVDCCGIFCAIVTYLLHVYAVYAVCFILLPPWMSWIDPDSGERSLSTTGMVHKSVFVTIAIFAVISHFKAMTTDPGAVPPDATPIPEGTSALRSNSGNSNNNNGISNADCNGISEGMEFEGLTSTIAPAVSGGNAPKVRRLCRRCKAFKPTRAHHCSVCKRCIIKMDHHCPWVNNCVGIGNHKYFLLFVIYTFISCMYSLVLVIVRFSTCMHGASHTAGHRLSYHGRDAAAAAAIDGVVGAAALVNNELLNGGHRHHVHHVDWESMTCLDKPSQLLNILGLLVEALLFGMFTSCMMFDQFDVIQSKVTHIDRLKGAEVGGSLPGIAEVFGVGKSQAQQQQSVTLRGSSSSGSISHHHSCSLTRFRPDWLSPFAQVCYPPTVRDEIMGFCRPIGAGSTAGRHHHQHHHKDDDDDIGHRGLLELPLVPTAAPTSRGKTVSETV